MIFNDFNWIFRLGLDNFLLENENKFDENFVKLLNHFLLQLPQPVCLVAHNGDKFDFPIIQRQLKTLNMTLAENLCCVDSLAFFRAFEGLFCVQTCSWLTYCDSNNFLIDYLQQEKLDEPKPLPDEDKLENEREETSPQIRVVSENKSLVIEEFCTPSNGSASNHDTVHPSTSTDFTLEIMDIKTALSAEDVQQKQKFNESTPSNRKTVMKQELFSKKFINRGSSSITPPSKRSLFSSDSSKNPTNPLNIPSKRMKFTLTAVHERFFGEEPNKSHYAESDTIALMKCVVASKMEFIEYAEKNANFFKDIKPIGM